MSSEHLRSESSNITISILKYIDLARAKSEAVVDIYRLLKQNVKSSNAKRRRQRKRDVQYAFLVHIFAFVLPDYNVKRPDTS